MFSDCFECSRTSILEPFSNAVTGMNTIRFTTQNRITHVCSKTVGKYYPTVLECSVNLLTEFQKVTNHFQPDLFPIYSHLEFAPTRLKV